MNPEDYDKIRAKVDAIDFVAKFRDRFPEEDRADYENRINALAEQITDGDTREAALVVDTWKNGQWYFWEKDFPEDADRDVAGTIRALEEFEKLAPHISKAKKILKEAGFASKCDHYDGHHLWVGQITDGDSGFVQHTVRTACAKQDNVVWLECCIAIDEDGAHMGWGDGYHRSIDYDKIIPIEDIPNHMDEYRYDENSEV